MEGLEVKNYSDYLPSSEFTNFELYLHSLGLPSDNIIATPAERNRIMMALPEFISSLNPEVKKEARYLSKFIAGSVIGLFDAALNYVWNEVIVTLRKKVTLYGLDLFFDVAVGEKYRDEYSNDEDLKGIKDKTLLETCRKLELISDLVYKKLSHILTMRNDIGASHPNTYSINSYELLGWLQTCIEDVIQIQPSAAALAVKSVVDNLKKEQDPLSSEVISQFKNSIRELSTDMTGNLLVTLFGIFTSESTDKIVQENILKLAPIAWSYSPNNIKYDLGEKIDVYKANLYTERTKLAERFFQVCDGNRFLSLSTRTIKLSSLCDDLYSAHIGWDNYYHEPPIIREIMTYVKKAEDIPPERNDKIIKTILICRIGREVSYQNGVSPGAKPYYDTFFKLLDRNQILLLLSLLEDEEVCTQLAGRIRSSNMREILELIKSPVNSSRVSELINFLIGNYSVIYKIKNDSRYKDLVKGLW